MATNLALVNLLVETLYSDSHVPRADSTPVFTAAIALDNADLSEEQVERLVCGDDNGKSPIELALSVPNINSALMWLVTGIQMDDMPDWSKISG